MKKLFASYIFLGLCLAVFAQGTVESSPTSGAGKSSDVNGAIAPKAKIIASKLPRYFVGYELGNCQRCSESRCYFRLPR